jgi:hypothetical protein
VAKYFSARQGAKNEHSLSYVSDEQRSLPSAGLAEKDNGNWTWLFSFSFLSQEKL